MLSGIKEGQGMERLGLGDLRIGRFGQEIEYRIGMWSEDGGRGSLTGLS